MKHFYRLTALLLSILLLAGCTTPTGVTPPQPTETQPTEAPTSPTDPAGPVDTRPGWTPPDATQPVGTPDTDGVIDIGTDTLPVDENTLYEQLFDKNNRIDIHIDMPETELAKLQEDFEKIYKSPIYRMADLLVTVTTAEGATTYRIPEVGVRMKGNTSRTNFYSPEEGIYNFIHFKLDFQETFDDEEQYGDQVKVWESKDVRKIRKNRTFATLEKLELRWNKCADSTYLKEGYAYDLYRSEGVLAPRSNLASLDWSGLHMGVYAINEPVDEVFLTRNLPAEDLGGDLYKLGWTYTGASFTKIESIGMEDEMKGEFYVYDLKSNKKTSQHESLKHLITQLNSGSVTKESYANLVDVDSFLSYAAVSYFLGNPDDLRNHYNNSYLYFLKSSGKAIIIPYDYDRCLGVTYEWNPTGNGMTKDNPFADTTADNNHSNKQENPLFIYSVDKGGYYVREYAAVLERVSKNILLQPETFEARFHTAKAIYGNDVNPGKDLKNDNGRNLAFSLDSKECGNLSFAEYITQKMATYRGYAAKVDQFAEVDVPVFSNFYIRGDFNDWSNKEEYAMTFEDGLWVYHISKNHDMKLKVYDNLTGEWYGTDFFDENTIVEYTTNHHANIQLKAGSYLVTFDPVNLIVTVYAE